MTMVPPVLGAILVAGVAAAASALAQGLTWDARGGWRLPPLAPAAKDEPPQRPR